MSRIVDLAKAIDNYIKLVEGMESISNEYMYYSLLHLLQLSIQALIDMGAHLAVSLGVRAPAGTRT